MPGPPGSLEHQGLPDDQANPDTPGDHRNPPGPIPDPRHQVTPVCLCQYLAENAGSGASDTQELPSGGHGDLGWPCGICDGTVAVTVCRPGEASLGAEGPITLLLQSA